MIFLEGRRASCYCVTKDIGRGRERERKISVGRPHLSGQRVNFSFLSFCPFQKNEGQRLEARTQLELTVSYSYNMMLPEMITNN